MRQIIFIFFLSMLTNVVAQDVTNGLIFHTPFDGDFSEKIGNKTIKNYGATLDQDRFGNPGCAYRFDGKSNMVVDDYATEIPEDEITVSFWARATRYTVHSPFIVDPDITSNRFNIHIHYYHNGAHSIFWDFGAISTNRLSKEGYVLDTTKWDFYTFTASKSAKKMQIWKNGSLESTLNVAGAYKRRSGDLMIGGFINQANVNLFYYGLLDEIRVYNRVLTTVEIDRLYKLSSSCNNLEIYDSTEVCAGRSFTPNPPNGKNFQWEADADISNLIIQKPQIKPTGTNSKTYTLKMEFNSGQKVTYRIKYKPKPTIESFSNFTICPGEKITTPKQVITSPGHFRDTFPSASGCDSIVNYIVSYLNASRSSMSVQTCLGKRVWIGGKEISTPGSYHDTIKSWRGCDSIITWNVMMVDVIKQVIQSTICMGEYLTFGQRNLYQAGIYYDTVVSFGGCDSVIELQLNVLLTDTTFININACNGRPFYQRQTLIDRSGVYYFDEISSRGCDSLLHVNVNFIECDTCQTPWIPNAFSPVKDGLNDVFRPIGNCPYQSYEFMIFNRWGEILFRTNNPFEAWDGNYLGIPCCQSVYGWKLTYKMERKSERIRFGTVHLLRNGEPK